MFDFLTGAVLLLSGIYEGFSLVRAINSLLSLNNALNDLDPGTAAYMQAEGLRNDTIFQIICCSALLLLTLICLLRFVRWAIIGNIAYMTHNTTKDFLKTTNNPGSGARKPVSEKNRSSGGMRITNSSSDNNTKS